MVELTREVLMQYYKGQTETFSIKFASFATFENYMCNEWMYGSQCTAMFDTLAEYLNIDTLYRAYRRGRIDTFPIEITDYAAFEEYMRKHWCDSSACGEMMDVLLEYALAKKCQHCHRTHITQ